MELPESVRFLVIKQAPAGQICAILKRLYPGKIADNVSFVLPTQPVSGNAMRIVLSPQYRFGTLMLWLVYFMGLFLVYILGSWLPTLVKEIGLTVSQAAIMTAIYQAGGTVGSLFAGWLMDRINPHRALGAIFAVGGLVTMAIGFAAASFTLLCLLALISGACLNGANTGMNALSARFYPTQARATGSSWMHGVGRIGAILSAFAGAEMLAMDLKFETVFLLLGIPALLTVLGVAAKGWFASGQPDNVPPVTSSLRAHHESDKTRRDRRGRHRAQTYRGYSACVRRHAGGACRSFRPGAGTGDDSASRGLLTSRKCWMKSGQTG